MLPERKEALDKWAKYIEKLVNAEDKSYHTSIIEKDVLYEY